MLSILDWFRLLGSPPATPPPTPAIQLLDYHLRRVYVHRDQQLIPLVKGELAIVSKLRGNVDVIVFVSANVNPLPKMALRSEHPLSLRDILRGKFCI